MLIVNPSGKNNFAPISGRECQTKDQACGSWNGTIVGYREEGPAIDSEGFREWIDGMTKIHIAQG